MVLMKKIPPIQGSEACGKRQRAATSWILELLQLFLKITMTDAQLPMLLLLLLLQENTTQNPEPHTYTHTTYNVMLGLQIWKSDLSHVIKQFQRSVYNIKS